MRNRHITRSVAGALAACTLGTSALAQEAMYTNAATMPSPGVFVVRPQLFFSQYGLDPDSGAERTEKIEAITSVQVGLVRALSLTLDIPVEFETAHNVGGVEESDDHDLGVSDLNLSFKWRYYQNDASGINTVRAALIAGARFASGDDHDFSSGSINPHIGTVLTIVRNRHGMNFEVSYQFNTGGSDERNVSGGEGDADAFRYNAAYLYRIIPERYTSTTTGAWYVTIELNGLYETNGDNEIRWSPGVMYEHRNFALEFMAQLPLTDNLRHRPELDFSFGVGVRITF